MSMAAPFGAIAAARDIIYDPFFGPSGLTIVAAPDGRVYSQGSGFALVRNNQRATCTAAANAVFSIDPAPQFNKDVFVTGVGNCGTAATGTVQLRVYARFNTTAACYFADWAITTGLFQIGYRDSGGAHTLTSTSLPVGSPNTVHTLTLTCKGTNLSATADGFGLGASDSRYAAGAVGFQFFNSASYYETFQCLRAP